jgi:hypothetical protein
MPIARRPELALAATLALAAALSPGPVGVRAQEGASPGAIRMVAEPPRLLLGKDGAADLQVSAPPDVQDLQLTASVGRVEDLRRVPGGFAARYRPPPGRIPQIAILAALGLTSHGAEEGWLAIPLSGQGDARVRAAPGTEITLRIGERTFGPKVTGPDGLAVLPVIVPPGVREAHHGFRPIDLRIPETPLVHAIADRTVVFADRLEHVQVLAYAVAPHGTTRRGDAPIFEASRGKVTVDEREPGTARAVWTLPPGRAGHERLVVRVPSAPDTRAVIQLDAVAGPPAVVAVSFDRDALVAGAADPVQVTARALDAGGNPVPARLVLEAEGAELSQVREREPGVLEGSLRASALDGRRELRVTASAPGAGITGVRVLPLAPGEPAWARFEPERAVLRTDGSRVARLRLAVADRYGNPVDRPPRVAAARGRVLAVEAAEGGFEVSYVGPAVGRATAERLVATLGPVSATAEPLLVPPDAPVAVAAATGIALDLRGRSRGPRTGMAFERAPAPGLLAELDLAWRGEVQLDASGDDGTVTLLGGAAGARRIAPDVVLRGSLAGGVAIANGGVGPALRLALGAGLAGRAIEPFLEAALLVAGRGAPGAFAAVGISAGVRLGMEKR